MLRFGPKHETFMEQLRQSLDDILKAKIHFYLIQFVEKMLLLKEFFNQKLFSKLQLANVFLLQFLQTFLLSIDVQNIYPIL